MTKDNQLISMGMDLGIYVLAGLMAEGYVVSPRGWEILKANRADELQKATNMPAEDIALSVQPTIDVMVAIIGQIHDDNDDE